MNSSPAHMYVLSKTDGMAVFRTRKDSLKWLYTAPGMARRGHTLRTDIRFAYLFGGSHRLTVLEPTLATGTYSATKLPDRPLDAVRVGENLYVALGADGLGKLNLHTPDAFDSTVQKVDVKALKGQHIIDLATTSGQFFALSNHQQLFVFSKEEKDISFDKEVSLGKHINRLFAVNDSLMAGNKNGAIFTISAKGGLNKAGAIGEPVQKIGSWKDWLIIQGSSGRLWTSYQGEKLQLWKTDSDAGNYFTVSKGQLWVCEYGKISRIYEGKVQAGGIKPPESAMENGSGKFKIQPIENQVIPYPHALLIPLKISGSIRGQKVHFTLQTNVKNAKIRGESLYWKPQSRNKGDQYQFKVIASTPDGKTSSTRFKVDVQPYNSPPHFIPLRTISIPVGHSFNLPIHAIDPDGMNKHLIRYIGVNLPDGASIDEQTGKFTWKPTARQEGKNTFRVIATDQYGAASSEDVTIKVVDTKIGEK